MRGVGWGGGCARQPLPVRWLPRTSARGCACLPGPGVGIARYLCGEGGVGSGRMGGDELSHYAGRGGSGGARRGVAAPRGVAGAALASGSLCPARCPAENDGLEGTKETACCW